MLHDILIGILCNIVVIILTWVAKKAFRLIRTYYQQYAYYRKRKH